MTAASGEAKRWYDSQGRVTGYDGTLYMTGFGTAAVEGNTPEGAASARSAALADLGSKLKTSIDSSSRITTSEFGKENFSSYQSDVTATVRLDLSGVESYETRYDPKQRRQLALCVLNKAQEQKYLSTQRSQLTSRLESQLREARDYLGKGRQDLLAATLDAMSLTLTDLSANASIDLVLGGSAGLEDSLKAFEEGIRLIRFCTGKLDEAERRVEILIKDDQGNIASTPFPRNEGDAS
jgi:exodeoxyribonuclease VII small subunit